LTDDPLDGLSLRDFGTRLRRGDVTVTATVESYLERIEALDGRLGAYEYVAAEPALATAKALDALLRAGVDLGPLMGVPVAVKDILAVDGMPTRAGSDLDVSDLVGAEGSFVKQLKRAGCVILGKAKTVEFALGAVGTNAVRGTPWNPCDSRVQRIPGGSSSGPAVAVAARLCAFAVGSDTGGSVRVPVAMCGVFGLKTTIGLWPLDGVFPLSPTFDTLGLLTRSAEDASTIFHALAGRPEPAPVRLAGLQFGKPLPIFYEGLDDAVASCMNAALDTLQDAGVNVSDIEVPEAAERSDIFPVMLPTDLLAALGRVRFEEGRARMEPVVAARVARVLDVPADRYARLVERQKELVRIGRARMAGFDGWLTPAAAIRPVPVSVLEDAESGMRLALAITQDSQPVNMFGQCGVSLPIHHLGSDLPVGLQIVCAPGEDEKLLALSCAIERALGRPPPPELSGFLGPVPPRSG
jgi:aspartyl-tRNA(Asn)/glutamyl-tRNA(Gln) amidotransferase subunit A